MDELGVVLMTSRESGATPGDYFITALARLLVAHGRADRLRTAHQMLQDHGFYGADGQADVVKTLQNILSVAQKELDKYMKG